MIRLATSLADMANFSPASLATEALPPTSKVSASSNPNFLARRPPARPKTVVPTPDAIEIAD